MLFNIKVREGAELPCTVEAAYIESLLLGVIVTMISLISAVQGYLGVGRFGNYILKVVFRGMVIVMSIYILLFLTEAVVETTVAPLTIIILSGRLFRLSNWIGRSIYR